MVTQPTHTARLANTDADLVRSALEGDRQAFDQLVERYFGMICAIGLAHFNDREITEDMAQEVFLRAYLFLPKLSNPAWFSSWITRMARNLAVDWLRRGNRGSRIAVMLPLEDSHERIADTRSPGARDMMQVEEETQAVREALFKLPVQERELVLLHFMEDLTQDEIGARLGVNRSTVSRGLDKALKRMSKELIPVLQDALPRMRVPQSGAARTIALVTAAAALTASQKAAICASVTLGVHAAEAPAAVTGVTALVGALIAIPKSIATLISSGGAVMGVKGIVTGAAALIIAGGGAYYVTQSDRGSAPAVTSSAQAAASEPLPGESLIPPEAPALKRYRNWDEMAREYLAAHPENQGLAKLIDALASVNVAAMSVRVPGQTKSCLELVVSNGWTAGVATPQFDQALRAQARGLEACFAAAQAAPFEMPPTPHCFCPAPNYMTMQTAVRMMLATARYAEASGSADEAAQRAVLALRLSACSEGGPLIQHLIGASGQSQSAKVLASVLRHPALSPKAAESVLTTLQDIESKRKGFAATIRAEARIKIATMRHMKNDPSVRGEMKPEERKVADGIESLPDFEREMDRLFRLSAANYEKPYWQRERGYGAKLKQQTKDPVVLQLVDQNLDQAADRAEAAIANVRLCQALAALRAGKQELAAQIRDPFVDAPIKVTADKVYSVGPDAEDQGGAEAFDAAKGVASSGDVVFLR